MSECVKQCVLRDIGRSKSYKRIDVINRLIKTLCSYSEKHECFIAPNRSTISVSPLNTIMWEAGTRLLPEF